MNSPMLAKAGIIALTILFMVSLGIGAPTTTRIDLVTRSFYPPVDPFSYLFERDINSPSAAIVQLQSHIPRNDRVLFSQRGIHLQRYVGGGAWTAYIEPDVKVEAISGFPVRWIGELLPEDRISPRITEGETPPWAELGDNRVIFAVTFMRPVSPADAEAILQNEGVEIGDYIPIVHTYYIGASPVIPEKLVTYPEVLWINFPPPPLEGVNHDARIVTRAEEVQQPPFNLSGAGVTVCVYDAGLVYLNHPDFEGRVIHGENGTLEDHSTHVAGSVAGNGGDQYRGMAPAANIASYLYEACDPNCLYNSPQDIWDNYFNALFNYNAEIATNSIGANIPLNGYPCSWEGDYELTSSILDSIVIGGLGDVMSVVFAAGNDRGPGNCGTTYHTMGVPANAKNIISVGATDDNDDMSDFSSWGPSDDGRIKPEVVAPGVDIVSCIGNNGHGAMSGTSMSTPITAGNIALMVEAYRSYIADERPNPSLLKAILCNSAHDLGAPGPDYAYGFGRVDAVENIQSIIQIRFAEGEVLDNGIWQHEFYVFPDQATLKMTLAWTDEPAAPDAGDDALINDLDLRLVSPFGETYLPFVLNPNSPELSARSGLNQRDVVEQVMVRNPEEGYWRAIVEGSDVPSGPQPFSIAANIPIGAGVMAVQGVVSDAETGEPIQGAQIYVEGLPSHATSEAGGMYTIFLQTDVDFFLRCESYGFSTQMAYVFVDEQPLATRNFAMRVGNLGTVSGVVTLTNGTPAANANVFPVESPLDIVQANAQGEYTMQLAAGRAHAIRTQMGPLYDERSVFVREGVINQLNLVIDLAESHITGPEAYGYVAIQSTDSDPLAPEYSWIEVDPDQGGEGTRVPMDAEETAFLIDLPFTFTYFGQDYNQFTVNENGFFCFGDVTNDAAPADFRNSEIPSLSGPPQMVAPFWEDFRANLTNFSYYHDIEEGLFILEWYNSRQFPDGATYETFEVVLYDQAVHGPANGDGKFLFQYQDVNDLGNATVGIEDHTETNGIEILFFDGDGNGAYDPTASAIVDGSAILFLRPSGSISGTVALHPAGNLTQVTVTNGALAVQCDALGHFAFPNTHVGLNVLTATVAGYEQTVTGIDLQDGDNVDDVMLDLWEICPPTDLAGEIIGNFFHLAWQAPWEDEILVAPDNPLTNPPGESPERWCQPSPAETDITPHKAIGLTLTTSNLTRGIASTEAYATDFDTELDEFRNLYCIYLNGSMIDQTSDLFYDHIALELEEDDVFWVTAVYDGGESDTSNHVYYVPGFEYITMTLPLQANYFELISTYIVPPMLDAEVVFGDIDHLSIVYQSNGDIYLPPLINTIGDITLTQGYQIFCTGMSELTIEGLMVENLEYHLSPNLWNWLGYPYDVEIPVTTALGEIQEAIVIVLTDDGRIWLPNRINSLGNMRPGEGYMVFATEDVDFQYNPVLLALNATESEGEVIAPEEVQDAPRATGLPYAVLVQLSDRLKEQSPAVIELYDQDVLVGKAMVIADFEATPVIAWQGSEAYKLPGFTSGDPIRPIVRNTDGALLPVVQLNEQPGVFGEGAYSTINLDFSPLPMEFSVAPGYPNPFNPTVTAPFSVPERGEVSFAVFNLLGQQVFQTSRTFEAGCHKFQFNAVTDIGDLGSGMYFLQVQYQDQVRTQKLMLLK